MTVEHPKYLNANVFSFYFFNAMILLIFTDFTERSLGANTFHFSKKLIDKVIPVRYCTSTKYLLLKT